MWECVLCVTIHICVGLSIVDIRVGGVSGDYYLGWDYHEYLVNPIHLGY